ncbi:hypothetical protein [Pseudomonas alabamensis]|uniref:hypothetical protein n=1 Tax=Pseudomonas alabamensis TaxID=3064349 RepID=UPI003F652EE6
MSNRHSPSPTRAGLDLQNARLLLGKRLSVLLHGQYYFNDEKDPGDIGSLEWRFGEREVVSMYLLSDGERVGADLLPSDAPASFEIEPNMTCSWKRETHLQVYQQPTSRTQKFAELKEFLTLPTGKR